MLAAVLSAMLCSLCGCKEGLEDAATVSRDEEVDLIFFMGQSNMAGKGGDSSKAPKVNGKAGVEFKAYSDPSRFYPISEPFGIDENNPDGLCEASRGDKRGSLVSAFINEYYELTGHKVIAVSCSMGGLAMDLWTTAQFGGDAVKRIAVTQDYLRQEGIACGHTYVVWLQGESDTVREIPPEDYSKNFYEFFDKITGMGIEEVFLISPVVRADESTYTEIAVVQKEICDSDERFTLATDVTESFSDEYFYDSYHLNQKALNIAGKEAAKTAADYTVERDFERTDND